MRRLVWGLLVAVSSLVVVGAALAWPSRRSVAADSEARGVGRPAVIQAERFDVSQPLRGMPPKRAQAPKRVREEHNPPRPTGVAGPAAAVQSSVGTSPAASVSGSGSGIEGLGQGLSNYTVVYAPSDANAEVGPADVVETVNSSIAIFDKAGARRYGPADLNTLWSGFGGGCETNNDGDAVVKYDRLARRWVISQFSVSTTPYLECVAVSQTADPTGAYYRYAFSGFGSYFPDYPKFGVWPDGYYVTFNRFYLGRTWSGARACAMDRNAMVNGTKATMQCFDTSTSYGSLLPADLDGTLLPPTGSTNVIADFASGTLNTWRFHVDWIAPSQSTFTGPVAVLGVGAFQPACGGGTCIPQPGTSQQLESSADRLMYRLAYRRLGGHDHLVVSHAVTAGAGSGVRWYDIVDALTPGTMTLADQGTFAPNDGVYRWMPSAAMDRAGDLVVGYTASSPTVRPDIRYAGRLASDPPSTLGAEAALGLGTGSQMPTLERWGDYTSMAVDPSDDCTLWYTGQYLATDGTWNWHTIVTPLKYSTCSTASAPGGPSQPLATAGSTGTGPTATAGDGNVTVAWSAPTSDGGAPVSSYNVYRRTDPGNYALVGSTGGSTYTDSTAVNGTTYYYRVTAVNSEGEGMPSDAVSATPVSPGGVASTAPTNLTAATAPKGSTGIRLSWSAPTNTGGSAIIRYTVYRGTATGQESKLADIPAPASGWPATITYADTGAKRNVVYYYRVTAVNAAGESPMSNEAHAKAR